MPAQVVNRIEARGSLLFLPLLVVLATCGPPLTDPSSLNITGQWTTADHVGPLSDVTMSIRQSADGNITGEWSAKLSPTNVACPAGLNATPTGPVTGNYTVVEIGLSLLGVGFFHGQKISPTEVRGSFLSCSVFYPVNFSLVSTSPGG